MRKFIYNFTVVIIILGIVLVIAYFIPNFKTADAAWYSSGGVWTNRKSITIDYQKVASTTGANITSFPMLFSVTDANLKSTGNGGNVGQTDGGDILFTNSTGATKLSHEIERYDATTGELITWVKVPFLSSTSTTQLFIYYGNASASDQWDITNVWDSNYKGVWHLPDGTTLGALDSTSNATNGTITGPVAIAGKVDGAGDFDGTADNIDVGDVNTLDNISKITYSAWVKYDTFSDADGIFSKWSHSGNGFSFGLSYDTFCNTSNKSFLVRQASTIPDPDENGIACTANDTLVAGNWYYATYVFDGTASGDANRMKIYINGVNQTLTFAASAGAVTQDNGDTLQIGRGQKSDALVTDGIIDEARVSVTNRSADWITTEYRNQSSPSTFYSYAGQEQENKTATSEKVRGGGTANLANPSIKVKGGVKFR